MKWEEILKWQEDMYLFSNYLYYECNDPLLSDSDYDDIIRFLENHYDELRPEIKDAAPRGGLKTNAFAIKITDQQKAEALAWVSRIHEVRLGIRTR